MRLPEFIVVGPPRTATTWLDRALRGHVGLPTQTKETHFFARNYRLGLDWYARHFEHCAENAKIGEICAAYFENPESIERIYNHIPNCKIICTLRDPVDRLYSYYKLMRHNGKTTADFEETVFLQPKMIRFSRYGALVGQWQRRFGKQNVLVVLNDDMVADPQNYIDSITTFIGIGRIDLPDKVIARNRQNTIETAPRNAWLARQARATRSWLGEQHLYGIRRGLDRLGVWRVCFEGGAAYGPVDPSVRTKIQAILKSDIEELELILGRDLSGWKT